MNTRAVKVCLAAIFVIILLVPSINADWTKGGIELCIETSYQYGQQIISDGAGGAIVVWHDDREASSVWDVYAQRFDSEGNILWDAGGVNISQLGSSQSSPVLVTDGSGGAIIVYKNNRTGDYNITAQRIHPDGTLAWAAGGLTVCGASNNQNYHCIVSDDVGGAIVAWQDFRSGVSVDIYAARINSTGNMPWTYNGVPVCQAADYQQNMDITTDGSSGAIITWEDYRSGNNDIYAQKINYLGSYAWTVNGNVVDDGSGNQSSPCIISDMNGGAIIAWQDDYPSDLNIMAERLLSDGSRIWSPGGGISVCFYPDDQYDPRITYDGAGGAIIAWDDLRNGAHDIYAQHVDFAGGSDWNTDGVAVAYGEYTQYQHEIVSDGHGGAIILWTDDRFYNNHEIFGQRLEANGTGKWYPNGLNLTSYPAYQYHPRSIATADGGIIVTWIDGRYLNDDRKIYAQKYDRHGYWGDPAPVITDVSDVPADQGGNVLIEWSPIRMDEDPEELITHYTIWRSVSSPSAMAMMQDGMRDGSIVTSPGAVGLDFEGTAYRTDIQFGAAAAWEWVASVEAHYWEEYAYTCGTPHDFIEGVEDGMHWFVISANTADQFTFWDSAPDSAYSIDNLAPCLPLALAGEQSFVPEGLELTWSPNTEADLGGYNIYRGLDPTFDPEPDYLIATTCDTMTFDGEWTWDSGFCYKVAAVDVHGNESGYAMLCFEGVTGDDPMPLPEATFLAQNFPNPFNPVTTIRFGLKEQSPVTLRIYDPAGRQVRELVSGTLPAGHYDEQWNGLCDNGSKASSGVYFYRLTARTFIETKKMILLR
jgi:hypothetical protein